MSCPGCACQIPAASRPIRRVLVIKLGALGDFFLAQTAFAAIRAAHADAHLTLLTLPALAPMARQSGLFQAVAEDPRGHGLADWRRIRRILRGFRFDRVYDLQCQSRTDLYWWLFFPDKRPEWSGTARFCSHPDRYPGRRKVPVIERYARQLAPFGIELPATADMSWLDGEVTGLAPDSPYVLLIPGSSPGRPDKRWPAERYGALAARFAERGIAAVVAGGPDETPLAAEIGEKCPAAVDLTGRTDFLQLAGLARRAKAVIGNDTGPTHLAASIGAPTLALFSDASNPIHVSGPRARIHHRKTFADMEADGVLAAVESLTTT